MLNLRHRLFVAFALWGAALFLTASLGGEFLHQRVHHHATKAAHDDCFLSHLLIQAFLVVGAAGFFVPLFRSLARRIPADVLAFSLQYSLPYLRAPPVSL